ADAVIDVSPYDLTYDGDAHSASGTATGVGGVDLSALLDLSGTTHTDAGFYTDGWSFAGSKNYNAASGTIQDVIHKADAGQPAIPIPLFPSAEARLIPAAGLTHFPAPTPSPAEFAPFTPPRTALLSNGTAADNLIQGTVFLDPNANRQQDEGEPGLGNMRVLL